MKKPRLVFIFFIVAWLGLLNYLIMAKTNLDNSLLSTVSGPVANLFTGNVTGAGTGNPLFSLIVVNIVIAGLFLLSYFRWEEQNRKRR